MPINNLFPLNWRLKMALSPSQISEQLEKKMLSHFITKKMPISKFKTSKFTKIWFSKPGNHPLGGPLNEFRLIQHKCRFPNDEISLICNLSDHDDATKAYLKAFCSTNKIKLFSLEDIEAQIKSLDNEQCPDIKIQLELLKIAKIEIQSPFGCLAAASDIVRTLSPVALMGIYTDFDITKKKNIPAEYLSPFGIRLVTVFDNDLASKGAISCIGLNNHTCAFDESNTDFLMAYRAAILKNYNEINNIILKMNEKHIFDKTEYKNAVKYMKDNKESLAPFVKALKFRAAMQQSAAPKNYDEFLKHFVLQITGPACLQNILDEYFSKDFTKIVGNMMNSLPQEHNNFKMLPNILAMLTVKPYDFDNDGDMSWLPSFDSMKTTFAVLNANATKIQSMVRMHQAKNKVAKISLNARA